MAEGRNKKGQFTKGGGGGASKSTALATIPKGTNVTVINARPTGGKGATGGAKKIGLAAAQVAYDERHTLYAVGAVALLAYLEGSGFLKTLPRIQALGFYGTYGLVIMALGRYMKSRALRWIGTGLLVLGGYSLVRKAAGGGTATFDAIEGSSSVSFGTGR